MLCRAVFSLVLLTSFRPAVMLAASAGSDPLANAGFEESDLRPAGHDLVLVAAAATMGGTWFLSFDRNSRQRPLAAAAGLRVWPPLEKDEKGLARHASQRGTG